MHHVLVQPVGGTAEFSVAMVADILAEANRVSGVQCFQTHCLEPLGSESIADVSEILSHGTRVSAFFLVSDDSVPPTLSKRQKDVLRQKLRLAGHVLASGMAVAVLAEMGCLEGCTVAAPPSLAFVLSELHVDTQFVQGACVRDGRYLTSSGGHGVSAIVVAYISLSVGMDIAIEVSCRLLLEKPNCKRIPASVSARFGFRNARLACAIALMHASPEGELSPRMIAFRAGISNRQLERLFRKFLGTSPGRYLQRLRLERGRQLIMHTNLPVTQVSLASGFRNPAHFSKRYRLRFGMSPTKTTLPSGGCIAQTLSTFDERVDTFSEATIDS